MLMYSMTFKDVQALTAEEKRGLLGSFSRAHARKSFCDMRLMEAANGTNSSFREYLFQMAYHNRTADYLAMNGSRR